MGTQSRRREAQKLLMSAIGDVKVPEGIDARKAFRKMRNQLADRISGMSKQEKRNLKFRTDIKENEI